MKKPIKFNYTFSDEDVLAITVSLPLVSEYGADNEFQQQLNTSLCFSAMNKLVNKSTDLSPNEIRVIALSIYLAREVLAGRIDFHPDKETLSAIRPHIFTYNRLYTAFGPLLTQMDALLDNLQ